jgi:pyrroloquinoline quinone biosynthesis protein D
MTPRLRSSVRLRHDRVRDRWMLLAPERGFVLNPSALAIVQRIDGAATVDEIAAALGHADDVATFVRTLVERRLVEAC